MKWNGLQDMAGGEWLDRVAGLAYVHLVCRGEPGETSLLGLVLFGWLLVARKVVVWWRSTPVLLLQEGCAQGGHIVAGDGGGLCVNMWLQAASVLRTATQGAIGRGVSGGPDKCTVAQQLQQGASRV